MLPGNEGGTSTTAVGSVSWVLTGPGGRAFLDAMVGIAPLGNLEIAALSSLPTVVEAGGQYSSISTVEVTTDTHPGYTRAAFPASSWGAASGYNRAGAANDAVVKHGKNTDDAAWPGVRHFAILDADTDAVYAILTLAEPVVCAPNQQIRFAVGGFVASLGTLG